MPRWNRLRLRRAAAEVLARGLAAAEPARLVRQSLRLRGQSLAVAGQTLRLGKGRLVLVAAGKAAVTMAGEAERILGDRLHAALAVCTSPSIRLQRCRELIAGHPLPDQRGLAAAHEVEALARSLARDDVLLVLLSGGASALLPAPAPGISLDDKAVATSLLLHSGASIRELNTVRKHLSRLKGGGLARVAAPARVVCLVLSDVVGDDPSTIASGPTVPDPTSFAEALEVLRVRRILHRVPASIRDHIVAGMNGTVEETPKRKLALFRRVTTRVVGGNRLSLQAAGSEARRLGLRPIVLTSRLEGEAREVARVLVGILREHVDRRRPGAPPVCLLAGGETTVTVRGDGRGGRNQELVVAAASALSEVPFHVVIASLATDGIDGNSDAAGGVVDQESVARAEALGLAPPWAFLEKNDSRSFLAPLGDLILTGPTGTNVADLMLMMAGDARDCWKGASPRV